MRDLRCRVGIHRWEIVDIGFDKQQRPTAILMECGRCELTRVRRVPARLNEKPEIAA